MTKCKRKHFATHTEPPPALPCLGTRGALCTLWECSNVAMWRSETRVTVPVWPLLMVSIMPIPQYRSYYTLGRGACWLRPTVPAQGVIIISWLWGEAVHGRRKLRSPYSQSYFWAEPPKIMLGRTSVSTTWGKWGWWSSFTCGPAQKTRLVIGAPHFPHVVDTNFLPNIILGGPAQIKWPRIGSPQSPHSMDGLPPKSRNWGDILLLSLFSLSSA